MGVSSICPWVGMGLKRFFEMAEPEDHGRHLPASWGGQIPYGHSSGPFLPHQPLRARLAVYDDSAAPPRVEDVSAGTPKEFIERLAERVYLCARGLGGAIPYSVIREVAENTLHAGFADVVVSILDGGDTIRFSDGGPGMVDVEKAFLPGFTTASSEMRQIIRGVGSGLPIVKEYLTHSGGSVSVQENLGRGTVVTLSLRPSAEEHRPPRGSLDPDRLTDRQRCVLSLVHELGSVGPSRVAEELGLALSTAHRDLAALERLGLVVSDGSGKRALTEQGRLCLDSLAGVT